jgi:hypothetical protein
MQSRVNDIAPLTIDNRKVLTMALNNLAQQKYVLDDGTRRSLLPPILPGVTAAQLHALEQARKTFWIWMKNEGDGNDA